MNISEITSEDRIAMAEAYRAYELMTPEDREKVPEDFVNMLLDCGNFDDVKPFETRDEFLNTEFSEKAIYLIMYMCTFK